MSMAGYTKLFNSILASTIWRESKETKILWITMLAMADKNGIVEASEPGLADIARLSLPETLQALKELSSPDTYSRTKEHEGRRIEAREGGAWQILNHAKYRAKMNADDRREYLRVKQAEHREKKRQQSVNRRSELSTPSTHAEAYTEADTKERITAISPASADQLNTDVEEEERRLSRNLVALRDSVPDLQVALDALPRKPGIPAFSAYRWLRNGQSGIPCSFSGLTVRTMLNAALEARQRAQDQPIISENNKRTFDALDRVTARMIAKRDGTPLPKELEG